MTRHPTPSRFRYGPPSRPQQRLPVAPHRPSTIFSCPKPTTTPPKPVSQVWKVWKVHTAFFFPLVTQQFSATKADTDLPESGKHLSFPALRVIGSPASIGACRHSELVEESLRCPQRNFPAGFPVAA